MDDKINKYLQYNGDIDVYPMIIYINGKFKSGKTHMMNQLKGDIVEFDGDIMSIDSITDNIFIDNFDQFLDEKNISYDRRAMSSLSLKLKALAYTKRKQIIMLSSTMPINRRFGEVDSMLKSVAYIHHIIDDSSFDPKNNIGDIMKIE